MLTRKRHRKFLEIHRTLCKQNEIKAANINKQNFSVGITTSESDEGDIHLPINREFKLINGSIKFSFEALPFIFNIDGHDKNLLLFVLAYGIQENYCFVWNRLVSEHYSDFYEVVHGNRPSYHTVRQSKSKLLKANIIRLKSKEQFMVNPLLIPASPTKRRELILEYGALDTNQNNIDSLFVSEPV